MAGEIKYYFCVAYILRNALKKPNKGWTEASSYTLMDLSV